MAGNTIEYLIRLRDDFTAKMQAASTVGQKGGAAIAQGMAVAVAAGLKFKDQISAGWDVLNGNYEALGTVLGALPGPLGQIGQIAGETLGKMIKDTEEAAEGYRKLSAATGASVEFLSGFKEAADDVRVSGEAVDSALTKFARGLGGVKDVSDGVAESGKGIAASLADIGIKANDAEGHVRPLADILPDVADAFSHMADGPQKTALAIQLFGKQGAELIPILNKGRDGLNEMMQAAKDAGLTMSGDTIRAVDELKKAQDSLGDAATSVGRKIGTTLIPMLADVVHWFNLIVTGSDDVATANKLAADAMFQMANDGKIQADTLKQVATGSDVLKAAFASQIGRSEAVEKSWGVLGTRGAEAAESMRQMYPELFNVSDASIKAEDSTLKLTEAQKKVTEGSVEYKDKTQDLVDTMLKRDQQLDGINEKEKALTEAYQKGYITSDQYSQGQLHLMDATAKVKDEFDKASGKIHDGAEATERMDKAAQGAAEREKGFEKSMRDAAAAAQELKDKTDNLTEGFGKMPEKMDAAAKAAMAWKLATGQITVADAEQTLVAQGLTQAYAKHKITLEQMITLGQQYRKGEISGEQALQQAGAWKDPAFVSVAKGYREVEGASGAAGKSELTHADYIKLVTTVRKTQKASMDDVIDAQLYLNKVSEADNKTMKEAKADLDAKKISERDYLAVQMNVTAEHDKVAAAAREVEKAYNGGKAATQSSIHIVDTYGQHLEDLGLKLDQYGNIVKNIPESKTVEVKTEIDHPEITNEAIRKLMNLPPLPVTADTTGFVKPVEGAKTEAEKPVTVPVKYDLGAGPSFGVGTPAPTSSMTLPVSFDTTGLDAQMKAAKDSLAKLGPAGVSLALDTISFDQSLLRVKSELDGLGNKTIDLKITTTGSATLPSNSSITVHVAGDTEDATKAIQAVIDKEIPEKTVFVNGDSIGAITILDAVNDAKVPAKTLIIQGAHKAALGAEVGSGDKTFAMDAIADVNNAALPLKTVVIAANTTHAMTGVNNVKTALEGIKDRTVFVNVVRNDITSDGTGNNGKGTGGSGGSGTGDGTNPLAQGGFGGGVGGGIFTGNKPVVYLAQNLYVRNELDLAMIKRAVDARIAEIFNR